MTSNPEFVLVGVRMKQQLSGQQTGGAFSLFENRSDGPSRTPIHVHANDDETLYMMEGEMQAIIDGKEHTLRAGESIFLPRGIPHQLMNARGGPSHYLLLCTPSGFEGFLEEGGHVLAPGEPVQAPTAADIQRLKSAAPRYGISLLQEWPASIHDLSTKPPACQTESLYNPSQMNSKEL